MVFSVFKIEIYFTTIFNTVVPITE